MAENTQKTADAPRKGRVGNFLVTEEIIRHEDAEPLSRLHITDMEHGWEVVIPQTYASAYGIIENVFAEQQNERLEHIMHVLFENFYLVTTNMDAYMHAIIRDVMVLGFTPAVDKLAMKRRKTMRKGINERLRTFEFPQYATEQTLEEERQEEIAQQARDIIDSYK